MKQFRRLFVTSILILSSCLERGSEDSSLLGLLGGSNPASHQGPIEDPAEPDTKAPYIQSSSPSYNAAHVPLNAGISFQFAELIDASTIQVNRNGTACVGAILLSNDGFETCVAFDDPNPDGLNGIQSLSLKPIQDLQSNVIYAVRVTRDLKDMAGNSLATTFNNTFRTQNIADSSFAVQCPSKFSRKQFLAAPSQFDISCTVQPVSTDRIIREVLIVPRFEKRDGTGLVMTKYDGISDKIFAFYNDSVPKKSFTLYGRKFAPSFRSAQTWEAYGYMRFGVHVHYADGDNVSTTVEMLLDNNVPAVDGFYYNVTAILNVSPFVPGEGELPEDRWTAWVYVDYGGGKEAKSPPEPVTGFTFIDLPLVVRPNNAPLEKLYIALDTTGDGIGDYIWPVTNYSVNSDGTSLLIFVEGTRVDDENRTVPVDIIVTPG